MATLIPIDGDESKFRKIAELLSLVPTDKEAEAKKKFKFGPKIPTKPKEIIPMFSIDYVNNKPFMRVPFRFGCGLLNKMVNRDKEFPTVPYNFSINLREHQVSIVQEAYNHLYSYGTTTLNVYTGCGKTIMSAFLLAQTKCIALVMINLQTLIASWYNTFIMCFPDLKDRIWIVGETPMSDNPALIICMDQRITQLPEDIRKNIGCFVLDEAHLFCTISKIKSLLYLEPKYCIINTATLDKNDGMEIMIESIAGKHKVMRLSEKPFKFYKVNTHIKLEQEQGRFGLDYSKLMKQQSECLERNMMIVNIIHGNPTHKFMVFTKTKQHVEEISKLLKHYGIEHDTLYGSKKKFEDKKVLLFSISKGGTGLDISAALGETFSGVNPDTLILASGMKSISKLTQVLGRVLRHETPSFVYMLDANPIFKRHYNETKDLFLESKGELIEVDYDASVAGGGVKLVNL